VTELDRELPEGYKMTELGPLPRAWEVVKLGDVGKTIKGRKPQQLTEDLKEGSVPYLTAEYFRTRNVSKFVPKDVKNFVKVDKDDIVFIWDGSNAGDVFTGLSGALASTMIKIDPEGDINKKFLYYYLKTKFLLFNTKTTGSTIPHVNRNLFYNLPVPLPPLPEQRKIAAVLSTVQEAKEKTEAVISAAKSLKKSMMSYLFTYGPVPLPDAENIPQKETEIGMIPEEWEAVRLGDVADLVMGQSPPGSTYNEIGEGLPFLQGKAEFGPLHPRHIKYTTKPIKTAPKNSVLLSVRAPVGDVNIADIDYCIGRGLTSVSLSEGNNLFLFYILSYLKDEIEKEGTGSTFKAITKAKLMNIKIPLPPLPTQQKIASMLSAIDEKIEAEENKKKALEDLFNTLLHNLMTARIRVNHLALDKAELAM